jgi:hypothetical protein
MQVDWVSLAANRTWCHAGVASPHTSRGMTRNRGSGSILKLDIRMNCAGGINLGGINHGLVHDVMTDFLTRTQIHENVSPRPTHAIHVFGHTLLTRLPIAVCAKHAHAHAHAHAYP